MRVPLEIAIRESDVSRESVESEIQRRADRLERFHDRITSCRIVVEKPQTRQGPSVGVRVRVEASAPPGHRLVAAEEAEGTTPTESAMAAVRGAFQAIEKQLKKIAERQSGETKLHPDQQVQAFVAKKFEDHGFLETQQGREVYFHRNSLVGADFETLEVGSGVWFEEQEGREGPQASTVRVLTRPRRGWDRDPV